MARKSGPDSLVNHDVVVVVHPRKAVAQFQVFSQEVLFTARYRNSLLFVNGFLLSEIIAEIGNRIQFGEREVSELPRENMNQLVLHHLEERKRLLTFTHQHRNQVNRLNLVGIEQLLPTAR